MNKSRVARDLWRKVFNDNLIDIRDADARKQVVSEFLADPINRKEGWKSKDARFFRLGLQSVAKEQNINLLNAGITPTPIRNKTQKGNLNLNVKSKQKKMPEMKAETPQETKENQSLAHCHKLHNYRDSKLRQFIIQLKQSVKFSIRFLILLRKDLTQIL